MGRWREIRDVVFLPQGQVPSRRRPIIGGVIAALVTFIVFSLMSPERAWLWNLVYAIVFSAFIQVIVYFTFVRVGKYAGSDPEPADEEQPAPDERSDPR